MIVEFEKLIEQVKTRDKIRKTRGSAKQVNIIEIAKRGKTNILKINKKLDKTYTCSSSCGWEGYHEWSGVEYLTNIGYRKDTIFITTGSPDIITKNDNKGWEVKECRYNDNIITFSEIQFYTMDDNVTILVFEHDKYKVIRDSPKYIFKLKDILQNITPVSYRIR